MAPGLAFRIFPGPAMFLIVSYSSWAWCVPRNNRQSSLTVHGSFQYSSGLASIADHLGALHEHSLEVYENALLHYRLVVFILKYDLVSN